MNRTFSLLALGLAAVAIVYLTTISADAQAPTPIPSVWLQNATPGTVQVGNINVSGTGIFGGFRLGTSATAGRVLTTDANGTGTWQPATTGLTLPYAGSVSSSNPVFKIINTGTGPALRGESDLGTAVQGVSNGTGVFGSGNDYGVYGLGDVFGVYGLGNSTGVYGAGISFGGFFSASATSGTGVYGDAPNLNGTTYGVYGKSDSVAGFGVYGRASAGTGSTQGGHFESASTSGFGVVGYASASSGTTYGGFFQSNSPGGRGVHAESIGTGVYGQGGNNGVSGLSTGVGGNGVFGEANNGAGAYGVYGLSDSGYGVVGTSHSTSGRGVYGRASANSGFAHGGWFSTDSVNGNGVVGQAVAGSGFTYGVVGETFSPTGTAVFGANSSPTGWGVYAAGRSGASGTKSFRIDHPHDPENRYLQHYCAEGPEPKNIYDGTARTDARGYATIALPNYFQDINRDPRIQLTVVDDQDSDSFVLVKVVQKVNGNSFRIRTSAPHVEVFWRVEAVRNDLWVQKHGAPVEVDKQGTEKGKYQHPELYGEPKERGMNYDAQGSNKRR